MKKRLMASSSVLVGPISSLLHHKIHIERGYCLNMFGKVSFFIRCILYIVYSICIHKTNINMISFFMGSNKSLNRSVLRNNQFKSINQNLPDSNNLKIGDEIGGHLVSGHIHGMGKVEEFKKGKEKILTISKPAAIKEYIFKKGYVAINGISLTVSSSSKKNFSVSLIPETIERTNLADIKKGDYLNIEADQQTIAIVETVKNIKK